ncbi:MAG: hypothetical protein AAFO81_10425 [Pseudomonadota bacterium]
MTHGEMFWLDELKQSLRAQLDSNTLSHAVLFAGAPGLGKRQLAAWLVQQFLGSAAARSLQQMDEQLADFRHLTIAADKKQISVEQVRALSAALALSSHSGTGKAAVIEPADAMTVASANSLLKTLEEPSGDALLVLVADDVSRLPATVVSRVSAYTLRTPAMSLSEQWLTVQGNETAAADRALRYAYGAPLKAQALLDSGVLDALDSIAGDLERVMSGTEGALAVANRWKKLDFGLVLDVLQHVTQSVIYQTHASEMRIESGFDRYVIDTRDAFCYLDTVQRAASRGTVAINSDMALDALALPWANKLQGCFDGRATRDY